MIGPESLPGEAPYDAYGGRDGEGRSVELSGAVFPIVRQTGDNTFDLIGTGFFITTTGLFVTAKHVLMDVLDGNGNQRFPISLFQFLPSNGYLLRPILRCVSHNFADVGVGVAAPMNNGAGEPLLNKILTLTTAEVPVDSRVVTYAYPKHTNFRQSGQQTIHMMPAFYDGYIQEYYPNGRDQIFLPFPCYRTSIIIHGGASGGPVFSRDGRVFGVNSTGFQGVDVSFVSGIADAFTLLLTDISIDGQPARSVRMIELVQRGHVLCEPPPL